MESAPSSVKPMVWLLFWCSTLSFLPLPTFSRKAAFLVCCRETWFCYIIEFFCYFVCFCVCVCVCVFVLGVRMCFVSVYMFEICTNFIYFQLWGVSLTVCTNESVSMKELLAFILTWVDIWANDIRDFKKCNRKFLLIPIADSADWWPLPISPPPPHQCTHIHIYF